MIVDRSQSAASEYFGVLRSRLLHARSKSDIRSVVITSPEKEDGKTFTSVNLAISLGQLRQLRILLIDGDLRRSGITHMFHLKEESGLGNFLEGWAPFEKCIKATVLPHLHIVPAGHISQDSLPAILEGARWPKFLQKAKEEFDLIIIDSVPVSVPLADFELLLNACDSALLVVQVGKTSREALDVTSIRMRGKLLGLIVNNKELPSRLDYHSTPYEKRNK